MFTFLSFLLCLITILNAHKGAELTPRILYGTEANIQEFPYFAHLSHCGAAIISEKWLVTAAHCIVNSTVDGKVWVGGNKISNSKQYAFDVAIPHPEFNMVSKLGVPVHDIALLRLTQPLTFSETVKPVKLPQQWYEFNKVHAFAGTGDDETGFGSEQLMKMDVRTLYFEECLSKLDSAVFETLLADPHLNEIMMSTICTTRIEDEPGLCYGDSGSALVRDDVLVGLAAFGSVRECEDNRLDMFTNVISHINFIKTITGIQ